MAAPYKSVNLDQIKGHLHSLKLREHTMLNDLTVLRDDMSKLKDLIDEILYLREQVKTTTTTTKENEHVR